MNLGEKIYYLRFKNNMSQEDLAKKLNVSLDTIKNYEVNITYPEVPLIKEIAKLFNVSFDSLLDDNINLKEETKVSSVSNVKYEESTTNKDVFISYRNYILVSGLIPLILILLGGIFLAIGYVTSNLALTCLGPIFIAWGLASFFVLDYIRKPYKIAFVIELDNEVYNFEFRLYSVGRKTRLFLNGSRVDSDAFDYNGRYDDAYFMFKNKQVLHFHKAHRVFTLRVDDIILDLNKSRHFKLN